MQKNKARICSAIIITTKFVIVNRKINIFFIFIYVIQGSE